MKKKYIAASGIVIVCLAAGGTALLVYSQDMRNVFAATSSELLEMYNNNVEVEIEVAEPGGEEAGEEVSVAWEQLAFLDTYKDMRSDMDDILDITRHGQGGKNGVLYIDLDGNQTNNSTLYNAFQNRQFVEDYWENGDKVRGIAGVARDAYVDVESDQASLLAAINGYYNLLNDSEPGYANLNSTLTRGEFLAFLVKADTPVHTIEPDAAFASAVGDSEYTLLAQEAASNSYLTIEDGSLNTSTFNGTITRGEAIYSLVSRYYSGEYASLTGTEKVSYEDAKNGGDVALKGGFAVEEKDKETKEVVRQEGAQIDAYELAYSLQNPDSGMPSSLYKALVIAEKKGWISGKESRWEEGITKGEAINLLTKVYESIGEEGGYVTDASRGLSEADAITDDESSGGNEGGSDGSGSTSVETPAPEAEASTEFDFTLIDPDLHATPSKDQYGQTQVSIDDIMAQTYKETVPGYMEWMGTDDLEQQVRYYFDGGVTKEDVYNYVLTGNMTFPTQQADSGDSSNSSGSGTTSSGGSSGSGGSTQVETPSQQPSGGNSGSSSESNPGGYFRWFFRL